MDDIQSAIEAGRVVEREEIIKELNSTLSLTGYSGTMLWAIDIVKRRNRAKKIDMLQTESTCGHVTQSASSLAEKINELIDAVNQIRKDMDYIVRGKA